jgi:NAD(P)H-dependent FMN reductase
MITIISGTNRKNSETEHLASRLYELLGKLTDEPIALFKLTDLPSVFISPEMYSVEGQTAEISSIQDNYVVPARKLWFIFPEYNGGVPGILKLFLDAISVRDLKGTFHGKKACLTGLSTGRAGNLRGMDHLTNILNYLQVTVMPNRLPISSIMNLKDEKGLLSDVATWAVIENQAKQFLSF